MTFSRTGAQPSEPEAETSAGRVRGRLSRGAMAFLGIPYASAARFCPPGPVTPWAGTKDCTAFGPNAPQSNPDPAQGLPPIILARLPRPEGAPPPQRPVESEDCQVLNVWTADTSRSAARPVMVWLHGGFFSGGSGSTVDGSVLAERHGVVVVSVNHRVNAFGFTDLSAYNSEFAGSANAGMADIVAALEWVQQNIAGFGGDPSRVMVFGTSGGGMKTSILMASPRAQGLMHRAGVQSGPGLSFLTADDAAIATGLLLREAGLAAAQAADLAKLPMEQLLGAYHRVAAQMRPARFQDISCFGPVVGDALLPRQPFAPDAAPQSASIPLIIGSNTDEMSFFMGNDPEGLALDDAGCRQRMDQLAPASADLLYAHYRALMPVATPSQRWIRCFSDVSIAMPVRRQTLRHAALGGSGTWLYRLSLPSPALGGVLGSTHTIETPLIFDDPSSSPLLAGSGAAPGLAAKMARAWCGLAADGQPGPGDWTSFAEAQGVMAFGEDSRFGPDAEQATWALLEAAIPG